MDDRRGCKEGLIDTPGRHSSLSFNSSNLGQGRKDGIKNDHHLGMGMGDKGEVYTI